MHRFASYLSLAVFVISTATWAHSAKVEKDLAEYDARVAEMRAEFAKIPADPKDKGWVSKKLAHMFDVDQYMRRFPNVIYDHKYSEDETKEFWKEFMPRFSEVDGTNTKDVKSLLTIYEWFKIGKFGKDPDFHGWLLVQHADHDRLHQKTVLSILEKLYKIGETKPMHYAYLYDRVAVGESRLQRYGTQGKCVGPGEWAPKPIEDEANVDKRRAEMGMGTMEEYKAMFKDLCKKADG